MFNIAPITTNDLILMISGFAVIVYAVMTYFLLRQSVLQTEIKLMPIPIIYIRGEKIKDRKFRIRNLGYGPMLNIKIDRFVIVDERSKKIWKLKLRLPYPNALTINEERDLIVETYLNEKKIEGFDLSPHLDPGFANFYIPLNIIFENIRGQRYQVKIGFGKGELKIIEPVKKINKKIRLLIRKIKIKKPVGKTK